VPESDADATELQTMKEERLSTEKCLQICAQLSEHINQLQITPKGGGGSSDSGDLESIPESITNEGLQECKKNLMATTAKLENHMQELIERMIAKSKSTMNSEEQLADLAMLQEQWKAARQCIDICSTAEGHLKENISTVENYATGDAFQVMVSTGGKTFHGKNRGLGWRSRQIGGLLSDISLQQISRDMSRPTSFQKYGRGNSRQDRRSNPNSGVDEQAGSEFKHRYGPGQALVPKSPSQAVPGSSKSKDAKINRSATK